MNVKYDNTSGEDDEVFRHVGRVRDYGRVCRGGEPFLNGDTKTIAKQHFITVILIFILATNVSLSWKSSQLFSLLPLDVSSVIGHSLPLFLHIHTTHTHTMYIFESTYINADVILNHYRNIPVCKSIFFVYYDINIYLIYHYFVCYGIIISLVLYLSIFLIICLFLWSLCIWCFFATSLYSFLGVSFNETHLLHAVNVLTEKVSKLERLRK